MVVPTIFSSSWKLLTYSVTQQASLLASKNAVTNHRIFQNWSPCPDLSAGTNDSTSCELTLEWLKGQRGLEGFFRGAGSCGFCLIWGPQLSPRSPGPLQSPPCFDSERSCWQVVVVTVGGHVFPTYFLKNYQFFKSCIWTYVCDLKY